MDVTKFYGQLLLVFLAIGVGSAISHNALLLIAVAIALWAIYQVAKHL